MNLNWLTIVFCVAVVVLLIINYVTNDKIESGEYKTARLIAENPRNSKEERQSAKKHSLTNRQQKAGNVFVGFFGIAMFASPFLIFGWENVLDFAGFLERDVPWVAEAERTEQGCDIKGNRSYSTQEKIYHLPSQKYYEETSIDTSYGERWFCSEQEALDAGWRKSYE